MPENGVYFIDEDKLPNTSQKEFLRGQGSFSGIVNEDNTIWGIKQTNFLLVCDTPIHADSNMKGDFYPRIPFHFFDEFM